MDSNEWNQSIINQPWRPRNRRLTTIQIQRETLIQRERLIQIPGETPMSRHPNSRATVDSFGDADEE
jgi:hypothetical protein